MDGKYLWHQVTSSNIQLFCKLDTSTSDAVQSTEDQRRQQQQQYFCKQNHAFRTCGQQIVNGKKRRQQNVQRLKLGGCYDNNVYSWLDFFDNITKQSKIEITLTKVGRWQFVSKRFSVSRGKPVSPPLGLWALSGQINFQSMDNYNLCKNLVPGIWHLQPAPDTWPS